MAADFAVNIVNELFCHTQLTQGIISMYFDMAKMEGGGSSSRPGHYIFFYNMQLFLFYGETHESFTILLYMQLTGMILPIAQYTVE